MRWTSVADAIVDLRAMIGDGPTDKLSSTKKLVGAINGTNQLFKTFEFRRVTDFTSAAAPMGIYWNNALITPATDVNSDDVASGDVVLNIVPADGDSLTATYYYQWFIDAELTSFLTNAANWIGGQGDVTKIDDGLTPAALTFAAQDAFHKLSMKLAVKASSTYMLEDAPKKEMMDAAAAFDKLGDSRMKQAEALRKQFYGRQDQSEAPLWGFAFGSVRDVTPRR